MALPMLLMGVVTCLLVVTAADAPSKNALGNIDENEVLQELHKETAARRSSISGGAADARLGKIREALQTMYAALPKNTKGKLGRQVVRYALHRFFVQRYGWFIRGLEPTRDSEKADLVHHRSDQVREWVPLFLQDSFEQEQHHEGADLDELVVLTAALEDVVHLEARKRFKAAFLATVADDKQVLNSTQAEDVLTTYYVEYLRTNELEYRRLAGERPTADDMSAKATWTKTYPHWQRDLTWIRGLLADVSKFDYQNLAHTAETIGEVYHSFNAPECDQLKATLHGMEGVRPGRVPLSRFYGSQQDGWKFTEKKEYMRALGLLDEADEKRSYVISTNYVLSRHNCFAPSDVYVVCCRSECESLMGQLEAEIGAPTASPSQIATLVARLPSSSVAAPRELSFELMSRLSQVAEVNGGTVPLHGRLFAQWMHHAYPQECPYPHQSSVVTPTTPSEWLSSTGDSVDASEEEMLKHIAEDVCAVNAAGGVDCMENTEVPWDVEEELLVQDAHQPLSSARWLRVQARMYKACIASVVLACFWLLSKHREGLTCSKELSVSLLLASRQPHALLGFLFLVAYLAGLLNDGLLLCMMLVGCIAIGTQKVAGRCIGEGCLASDYELHKLV